MSQQINLCTPILLTQKRYFSAQTMAQALAIFLLLGGGLCAYWVWALTVATEGFKQTLTLQARELETLDSAIKQSKASAVSMEVALTQDLQGRRAELQLREQQLAALELGLFLPGWGHSNRLQLVAQSIPSQVWVTDVKADDVQLVISGFTFEPAALNDWVSRLSLSPLLKGQKLATIRVENVSTTATFPSDTPSVNSALPAADPTPARPVWAFQMVSAISKSSALPGSAP